MTMDDPGGASGGGAPGGNLLCVANFASNTGFAWTFIEGLFAGLAQRLEPHGVSTWVAYPEMNGYPETLRGSPAEPLELRIDFTDRTSLRRLREVIRERRIETIYLCDRPTWHAAYALLRSWGVRTIIVHDHASGSRDRPGGLKRLVKRSLNHVPGCRPERVIAVSDFVARRLLEVNLCPPESVVRIWNSVIVPRTLPTPDEKRHTLVALGLDPARPVVGCAARATGVKGIFELMSAFDRVWSEWEGDERPQLVYLGDGPAFGEVLAAKEALGSRDSVVVPGYTSGADDILGCVNVAVVPSLWEEAFGLAALEPLARGVPVVASRAGGIPEVVEDGVNGLLVRPGSVEEIASAVDRLLRDPALASTFGAEGRKRAFREFDREVQVDQLEALFRSRMGI